MNCAKRKKGAREKGLGTRLEVKRSRNWKLVPGNFFLIFTHTIFSHLLDESRTSDA